MTHAKPSATAAESDAPPQDKPGDESIPDHESDRDADILAEAKEAFDLAVDAETENRERAEDDLRFARMGDQWPEEIKQRRADEGRPCLTINRMQAFIRQVVNDARLNKPSIKVHPADSNADPETAKIINGLIRNIEYTSNADVAYDTAAECAASMGFGYFRIGLDYAHDDTFDLDITIDRISNPLQVYGDPFSTAADSSDWDSAFVTELVPKKRFEAQYKGADPVDWHGSDYGDLESPWIEDETVLVAEWWTRDEVDHEVARLSNGVVVSAAELAEVDPELGVSRQEILAVEGIAPEERRITKTWKVTQRTLTGAEVLKTETWPGRYIPIVPVYGDEVDINGKRYFKSLIHDAKDAQRMFNYWRTTSTELVALAPKTPFIGPTGAFSTDINKWVTANTQTHPFIEYDGAVPPQRQAFAGPPAAALQEALNASDDMKAIIGLYDASLGARSNETSGKAILARQREGDVATFHFIDNLTRAIRHAGRIIIDLIPHVYDQPRIVRVLGEDGTPDVRPINQDVPELDENGRTVTDDNGDVMSRIHDLTAGKYDLTVSSGPSFTTRREEAAEQMMQLIQAFPQAAPVMGDLVAKNLDWPGADEIAERLKAMLPAEIQPDGGLPTEIEQGIREMQEHIERLQSENEKLKADKSIETRKVNVDEYEAETGRLKVVADPKTAFAGRMSPDQIKALVFKVVMEVLDSPDVATSPRPAVDKAIAKGSVPVLMDQGMSPPLHGGSGLGGAPTLPSDGAIPNDMPSGGPNGV
ncbi:MAG: hypothetical protein GY798_33665 [Hyphomicrobiales bacterium]|nr:hypothetical protein [Hyphomicrobiales bacterium]